MTKRSGKPPTKASIQSRLGRQRLLHANVKTARKRSSASTQWLQRQLNDPYVALAKQDGYRSRAAYKLIELQDKFRLLKSGGFVVDLGAAPGGWAQVALDVVTGGRGGGKVVAADLLPIDPIDEDVILLQLDFTHDDAPQQVKDALGGMADCVLTDMAPSFTGHAATDHLRTIYLVELALDFAMEVLKPGGHFAAKILHGSDEHALLNRLKQNFRKVKLCKPDASRDDSAEMYVVALERKPS